MATGNKRVSQLVELTSAQMQPGDWLLIIDVTAKESKKIKASELSIFLNGTGSTAISALTASYILGSNVDGPVKSASFANSSSTSLYALTAGNVISASYSLTSSFALNAGTSAPSVSSSFLIYTGSPNGTASYAVKALSSTISDASNFLNYFGGNNGTASYAITTQNVNHATNADTASYVNTSLITVSTASYAHQSDLTYLSQFANSASYLIYSGNNNGTASYAMAAKSFANIIVNYGVYQATTQSAYKSQLDDVDILWSTSTQARTPIEAIGTVIVPFTSSAPTIGTIYLSAIDRNTGVQTILDSTTVNFTMSPTMGAWGNFNSGSVSNTFSLIGQANLYGSYIVFVSSSNNIQIDTTRNVRFNISSESDTFATYTNNPIGFNVTPSSSLLTFSSTDGPIFNDYYQGLVQTMSLNKQIFTIQSINTGLTNVNYFWLLSNVTASNFSNNPLANISGVPNSLTYFSCSNCNLTYLYTFTSSSVNTFNVNHNSLTSLPSFPFSMSYFDCSFNNIANLTLPVSLSYLNCSNNSLSTQPTLPAGLSTFIADNNNIPSLSSTIPSTIVSMSLNNNTPLFSILSLPLQLGYFSINNTIINSLPGIPVGLLYLSSYSCSFNTLAIDNITSNLVSNTGSNGYLDIRGNGLLSLSSLSNVTTLQSRGWTTLYDV